MKSNGTASVSPRTARTIALYGMKSASYFALRSQPKVMQAFHLMTPRAMARLNEMAGLLERLGKNMEKGVPNLAARRMLLNVGLECVPFQFYGRQVLAYGLSGRTPEEKQLLKGMIEMYKDNEVDKYYDLSLLGNYNVRYTLFTGVILCLGITAVIVPLIIRLVN